jgi:competence transcription factor ComK
MSGLHTSINMHVAYNFFDMQTNRTYVNHKMFLNAIGKHPDRIRNLFFLYAVIVKAVNRADTILRSYDYDTHLNVSEDK